MTQCIAPAGEAPITTVMAACFQKTPPKSQCGTNTGHQNLGAPEWASTPNAARSTGGMLSIRSMPDGHLFCLMVDLNSHLMSMERMTHHRRSIVRR